MKNNKGQAKKNTPPKPKQKNPMTTLAKHTQPAKPAKKPQKKNPATTILFGRSFTPFELVKIFVGGLTGVMATKLIAARMPAEVTSTPTGKVLTSGAIAFAAGYGVMRADADLGAAVLFGGGMQTASVFMNGFLPELAPRLALSGMGDLGDLAPVSHTSIAANPFQMTSAQLPAGTSAEATYIPIYEGTLYQ